MTGLTRAQQGYIRSLVARSQGSVRMYACNPTKIP